MRSFVYSVLYILRFKRSHPCSVTFSRTRKKIRNLTLKSLWSSNEKCGQASIAPELVLLAPAAIASARFTAPIEMVKDGWLNAGDVTSLGVLMYFAWLAFAIVGGLIIFVPKERRDVAFY